MAEIVFDNVTKRFEGGAVAVEEFSLDVADGEFMVLVGPSGSGKTTAMRMVAGLEEPTEGEIRIGERRVNDLAPRDRNVGMIFQNYALYPHMTVAENMAFPLKLARVPQEERKSRVEQTAKMLGLSDLLRRKPRQLSGGQRQRVAMGRAIVRDADAFLMDEPLSNLDAKLRVEMRAYIASLHEQVRTTTLYVTHDQSEAMTMGDRVALLRDGRLEQVDAPTALYERPQNLFVATFVGSPAMNIVRSRIVRDGDGLAATVGDTQVRLNGTSPALAAYADRDVLLGIRPEDFEDAAFVSERDARQSLRGIVRLVEQMGSETIVHFDTPDAPEASGEEPRLGRLVARVNPRTRALRGGELELAVDVARVHCFDPETEQAIR
jgi:multiple sugar transport system ATP-binding protein